MNTELYNYREKLQLSKSQMARLLGVPRMTYVKWESGDRRLTAAPKRLIQVLHVVEIMTPLIFESMVNEVK